MKPLFYLAGPITRPDPMVNTAEAIRIAETLMARYPIVLFTPQLSVLHQLVVPRTHKEWLAYDFNVITNCHGLIRLPGESVGADMEVQFARALGVPVYGINSFGNIDPPAEFADYLDDIAYDDLDQARLDAAVEQAQAWGDEQYATLYGEKR